MYKIYKGDVIKEVHSQIENTRKSILLASPFLSDYIKEILKPLKDSPDDRRILIRFDSNHITTFHLDAMNFLLDKGFEIRYNNNIHLKLYIFDTTYFITSANLTKGGFEKNIEMTAKTDFEHQIIIDYFNQLWKESEHNCITKKMIEENYDVFMLLKKRSQYKEYKKISDFDIKTTGNIDFDTLLDLILKNEMKEYNKNEELIYDAHKLRKKRVKELLSGNNYEILYVDENHPRRRDCLFYDFQYGYEEKFAGTGLKEYQFRAVFLDKKIFRVLSFMLSERVQQPLWNLKNNLDFYNLCHDIFDFNIKEYVETLPIRLVSYFYPDYVYPIFTLHVLKDICKKLGFREEFKSMGDQLFYYTTYKNKKLDFIPTDNYRKSKILYSIYYTYELFNAINSGVTKIDYLKRKGNDKKWIERYINRAETKLKLMKLI